MKMSDVEADRWAGLVLDELVPLIPEQCYSIFREEYLAGEYIPALIELLENCASFVPAADVDQLEEIVTEYSTDDVYRRVAEPAIERYRIMERDRQSEVKPGDFNNSVVHIGRT